MSVTSTPPAAAAAANFDMTSSLLQPLHDGRETVYNEMIDTYQNHLVTWKKECTTLQNFAIYVRNQGHLLQNCKVAVPPREELEKLKEENLQIYSWIFKTVIAKIDVFSNQIADTSFLSQKNPQYISEDQTTLTDLKEQLAKEKEICEKYKKSLNDAHVNVIDLKKKMVHIIENDNFPLTWSLPRFCDLVNNEGRPLSLGQRGLLNVNIPYVFKKEISQPKDNYVKGSEAPLRTVLQQIDANPNHPRFSTFKSFENLGANTPNPTNAISGRPNDVVTSAQQNAEIATKPAETAVAPKTDATATAPKPAEVVTTPQSSDTGSTSKPNQESAAKSAETAVAPKTEATATAPKPAEVVTTPQSSDTGATSKTNQESAAKSAETAVAPKTEATATAPKPAEVVTPAKPNEVMYDKRSEETQGKLNKSNSNNRNKTSTT